MARLLISRGARATESLLLKHVEQLFHGSDALRSLASPIRLIVPSWSLRDHLSTRLMRHFGRPIVGLKLQTLHQTAVEILTRTGEYPGPGRLLFEILVRRFAGEEPVLRQGLAHLDDGYATILRTVIDFIEAGFDSSHSEALDERLSACSDEGGVNVHAERAQAIVRVSARTQECMSQLGAGLTADLFALATGHLQRNPDQALPSRAVLVHGFADATGVAADFIQTLMRYQDARVYLDHPQDPATPRHIDSDTTFTKRLLGHLEQVAMPELGDARSEPLVSLTMLKAAGAHAELRAVAVRISKLLDQGVEPEQIGVVCRALGAYRTPLRTHFHRLGIPFSGMETFGPQGPLGRRIQASLALMTQREKAPVDLWLSALENARMALFLDGRSRRNAEVVRSDLRLAFHAVGVSRLADLADWTVDPYLDANGFFPLPSRRGLSEASDNGIASTTPRAPRRRLPGHILRNTAKAALSLLEKWNTWPQETSLQSHLLLLEGLLVQDLGWHQQRADTKDLFDTLNALSTELPNDFFLSYEEFGLVLSGALSDLGSLPLGGRGGGVQVLDVMEARSRTFEHLFLIGLNRDVFPRLIREDPLLPDYLRRALLTLLPDLPIKRDGYEEERFLFAELLSSSPQVTLSWQTVDDRGHVRPVSPLVERLRLADQSMKTESAPSLYAKPRPDDSNLLPSPRPAHECAVLTGLYGGREPFSRIFPVAVEESLPDHLRPFGKGTALWSRARLAVLNEWDPDPHTAEGRLLMNALGPYYGFTGRAVHQADPRLGEIYMTRVENMAACPWHVLLRQLLHIQPVPDPMEVVPSVDASMLGSTVHATLERLIGEATDDLPKSLIRLRGSQPRAVAWPIPARLDQLLNAEAERVLRQEGIVFPGLARALKEEALPYLEIAGALDWAGGRERVETLGAEIAGELKDQVGDERSNELRFKVDRVDVKDGQLILTDYKTGSPISDAKKEQTRRDRFLKAVGRGEYLQVVAYVIGAGPQASTGRYLFLKPAIPEETRSFFVTANDADFISAFRRAVRIIVDAMVEGCFFPRLVEPDGRTEPSKCTYCEVSQACLRGDSTARARLLGWIRNTAVDPDHKGDLSPAERALLDLWRLRSR